MTDEALGLKKEGQRGLSQPKFDHLNVVAGCFGAEQIDNEDRKAKSLALFKKQVERLELLQKAKHQRRRQELTQTTPDQPVDDEAVYYKVAGDYPKGCVYSLRSLWRKKRRYVDPDASTSHVLAQRGMSNFMILRGRA
ncbi:hypothetical protein Syun_014989 [Stephania yunnanensis]|uniref:Uncharacterized protein n=1 Tax=Stephania yunnanensis TaxID=152371 RepID=A0AAP0JKP8_9MAGN